MQKKEFLIVLIFVFLFWIILIKTFTIQVIEWSSYQKLLDQNHNLSKTTIAQRWNIYVSDASQVQPLKLTENVTLYTMFIDPSLVYDKQRLIQIMSPLLYVHFCQLYGFDVVDDKAACIRNIEQFTTSTILPVAPVVDYYGQGVMSWEYVRYTWENNDQRYDSFDWNSFNANYQEILSGTSKEDIEKLIQNQLDEMITIGDKKYNYLWYYTDPNLLAQLKALNRDYIFIYNNHYVFIEPKILKLTGLSEKKASDEIKSILIKNGFLSDSIRVSGLFTIRANRYVRLATNVNPRIIDGLHKLEDTYYTERGGPNKTPLLYGIGTESYVKRYYPYETFMSHILGYLWQWGEATYGVEEYFDSVLKWENGSIEGVSSSSIGELWANDIKIKNVKNGYDVFLTIDPVIQTQAEQLINKYREQFRADSVSVLVYDPYSGQVLASANAPYFDPNRYSDVYKLEPLRPDQAIITDNITYLDFPIYIKTGGETRVATIDERRDTSLEKFVMADPLGPNLFVDKNIAYPSEPWSIFKAFTFAVGLDQNEINTSDYYEDPKSEVKVGPYIIKNADKGNCMGTHTFLHALQFSCNVGMVRIAQKLTLNTFYNYVEKFWFGSLTNIELAWEDPWYVEGAWSVSLARFFNNVFGQWLLTTPIQIAAWYGAIVNGGTYIKPTILDKICEQGTDRCQYNEVKTIRQILEPRVSDEMIAALGEVNNIPSNFKYSGLPAYDLGGKSWTSQLSFKGKYMAGNWWTNGSFVWLVTIDNPKYIIVVQVRRPRSNQRWGQTSGVIFRDLALFLINYETLKWTHFDRK